MRNLLVLLLLTALLGACAQQSPRPNGTLQPLQGTELRVQAQPEEDNARGELLYLLLVGELAGQMGALDLSVSHYLMAALMSEDPAVSERATRIALFADQREAALRAAMRWVELAPASVEGRQVLGALLVNAGRVPEAVEQLDWVVQNSPQGRAAGHATVANLLSRSQNQSAALEVMGQLAERYPGDASMQLALARLALQMRQPEPALEAAERALSLEPALSDAKVLRARAYTQMGDLDRGVQIMREAVAADAGNTDLRLAYGRLLIQAGAYDQARAEFEQLIARRPGDGDLLYTLGLLSLEMERYEDAQSYFTRLLGMGHRPNDANYYLGRIAETERRSDDALRHYRGVGDGDHFRDARVRKALLMGRAGQAEAAVDMLREMRRDADEPDWRVRLYVTESQVQRDARQYQAAMETLDQGLLEQPDSAELLYARALVAEKLDRLDILEADLRAILARDPDNAAALNALGYTLADRTDRLDEAYAYIRRAHEQHPEDAAILDSMGWVLYRMGRLDEAEAYLRQAYDTLYDPEIASNLAMLLWDRGQRDEARRVLEDALAQDPDHERLLRVKDRFEQ